MYRFARKGCIMAEEKTVYLDNAATTRVDPRVVAAMLPYFTEDYGNAASQYYEAGRRAQTAMEAGRAQLAALIGATPDEVFFTCGATESNNWVIMGTVLGGKKKHVISSVIEHHAILEPLEWLKKNGYGDYTLLPVDKYGRVDPDDLRKAIRDDTGLVTIMHSNNEIGTIQPIAELAAIAREKGVPFHTDATQAVGKVEVDVGALGVQMLSLSGHKFHAPKGIGALYIKKGTRVPVFMHGGAQERNRRAGTSNVAGAVGLGKAAELARAEYIPDGPRQAALIEDAWAKINAAVPKIHRNGHPEHRIPNLLSVCVEGAEGEAILGYLNMYGIEVSSGSACTSGSLSPSHVLVACGVPVELAHGSIRITTAGDITAADMDRLTTAMPEVIARLRSMSVTWKG